MDADLASRTAPLILSWDDYLDLRNWWHTALAPHTAPDPPFSAEFMGHPLVVVNG